MLKHYTVVCSYSLRRYHKRTNIHVVSKSKPVLNLTVIPRYVHDEKYPQGDEWNDSQGSLRQDCVGVGEGVRRILRIVLKNIVASLHIQLKSVDVISGKLGIVTDDW